jgi:7-keto-8-aminopelargonate synthetase-like enzyme
LLHRARSFVFTTALPAPVVAASHAAIDWIETAAGRERCAQLADNCRYFHERRRHPLAGPPSHIVPILVRDGDPRRALAACDALLERGIFAQAIRPPTVPAGTSRLRFSIMATHSARTSTARSPPSTTCANSSPKTKAQAQRRDDRP